MNKILSILVLTLLPVSSLFAQNSNLLENFNGDFERGLTYWRFFEVPNNLGSSAEVTTTDVASGSKAVKITFVADDGSVVDRGFDNQGANVPVQAGGKYVAGVQARVEAGNDLYLRITFGFFDINHNVIDEGSKKFLLSTTFQKFELERTAPPSAAMCWIAFRLFDASNAWAAGTLYLDDASIVGPGVPIPTMKPRVMHLTLPSDDVPIASIDITEEPYSVKNDGSEDATAAFQSAIDFAATRGGAVIFVPAGRYRFDGTLLLREKVILRGDWAAPDEGGSNRGTILMPYAGRGNAEGEPFIRIERGAGIRNLTIWYPEQSISNVTPYPWAILCNPNTPRGSDDNTSVVNVTLVNPYQGIKVGPVSNELHYIRNVYGTPLKTGIWLSRTTDIGRIMNVHFEPRYWSQSGFGNSPGETEVLSWLQNNAEGIVMGRSDWEYMYDVSLIGYKTGIRIFRYSGSPPNGVIYGLLIDGGQVGIQLDEVNGIGFAITGSTINASAGPHPVCVQTGDDFDSVVQFNTCTFGGQPEAAIRFAENSTGRITFQNCTFVDWGYGSDNSAAIDCNKGTVEVMGCEFQQSKLHFRLGSAVPCAYILDSVFADSLQMQNASSGEVLVSYEDLNLPALSVPPHPFAAEPRPATDDLFVVQDYGAIGDGQTDDTEAFQAALDAAGRNGGGTVYVPAGWYHIGSHLVVPAGVELRGMWDVPHHTMSRGSVLLAFENKGDANGEPFISLAPGAGVRGLMVWYPEQNSADIQPFPWTIQARGANCWVKDVSLGNTYQGVDMGSYPSENHVVSYLAGSPLKVGLYVSKNSGEGWVENVQFNPHYWMRSAGYPKVTEPVFQNVVTFQQSQLDAFKFGTCQREHILGTFVFAAYRGIYFANEGAPCRADVFLHGTDVGSHATYLESTGDSEVNFINSQLVLLGATPLGIITTDDQFSAKAHFYNTLAWGAKSGPSANINGTGTVTIQQMHTKNGPLIMNSGTTQLQNITFPDERKPQYIIHPSVQRVEIFGSYAPDGIDVTNEAGDKVEADYNFGLTNAGLEIKTGWEEGDRQNDWDNTIFSEKNIGPAGEGIGPLCTPVRTDSAHTGQYALSVVGRDQSPVESFIAFKIMRVQLPVLSSTLLTYWLKANDELGRNVHIDILFTDGTRLSDFAPTASDSLPLTAARGQIGQWQQVVCPLGRYAAGKTTQTVLVGYNRAEDSGDFSALIDDLQIHTPELLPSGWLDADVGEPQIPGYALFAKGSFLLKGSGPGLWFLGDVFHFTYQKVAGDISITARLDNYDDLPGGAFAGLMIRQSDSTKSTFVALISSPRYGVYSKWRMPSGLSINSALHRDIPTRTPLWFRLTRQGDLFSTYYSVDGTTWGEPLKQVSVAMDSTVLVGLAAASGFYDVTMNARFANVIVSDTVTTKVASRNDLPHVFQIYPNFPNPFNPQTTLRYTLPKKGHVTLRIYDINGRLVTTLVNTENVAGVHTVTWIGRDWQEQEVSSGVYLYRIQFGDQLKSGKMVLIR